MYWCVPVCPPTGVYLFCPPMACTMIVGLKQIRTDAIGSKFIKFKTSQPNLKINTAANAWRRWKPRKPSKCRFNGVISTGTCRCTSLLLKRRILTRSSDLSWQSLWSVTENLDWSWQGSIFFKHLISLTSRPWSVSRTCMLLCLVLAGNRAVCLHTVVLCASTQSCHALEPCRTHASWCAHSRERALRSHAMVLCACTLSCSGRLGPGSQRCSSWLCVSWRTQNNASVLPWPVPLKVVQLQPLIAHQLRLRRRARLQGQEKGRERKRGGEVSRWSRQDASSVCSSAAWHLVLWQIYMKGIG